MRLAWALLVGLALGFSAWAREAIFFVGAHPDDTEGFGATAFLLGERYDLHVVDLTRGELGLGPAGLKDGSTAARRTKEEEAACGYLGARLHFLGEVDGSAAASASAAEGLAELLRRFKPKALFAHWPVDLHADHVQAMAVCVNARRLAKWRGEFYFYEVERSQTRNFRPLYSVDVSRTIGRKLTLIRHYVCQNANDALALDKLDQARVRGASRLTPCAHAEVFTTYDGERIRGGVLEELPECEVQDLSCLFDISRYGAREGLFGVDVRQNSRAIAAAVEACAARGGGQVVVPKGRWRCGAVHLRSNVHLRLEEGAFLIFEDNPACYLPAVLTAWEGMECMNFSPLVYAYGATNTGILGSGTLAPRMGFWRERFLDGLVPMTERDRLHISELKRLYSLMGRGVHPRERILDTRQCCFRPPLVEFNACTNVTVRGIRIRESPFWTLHFNRCENVLVEQVDSRALGRNADGVNIERCRKVRVRACRLWQGDDAVVLKAGRNRDGWDGASRCEDVEIDDVTVTEGHGLLIVGSEMSGGVRNVTMRNSRQNGASFALFQLKCNERRGGTVEQIRMENCSSDTVRAVLDLQLDSSKYSGVETLERRLTKVDGLTFEGCRVGTAGRLVQISGTDRLPVKNIRLANLDCRVIGTRESLLGADDQVTLDKISVGQVDPKKADWIWRVPKPWYAQYEKETPVDSPETLARWKDLGDFRLRFEFKPSTNAFLRIRQTHSIALDSATAGSAGDGDLGALYPAFNPQAEWQQAEVILHRGAISVAINGFETVCNRSLGPTLPERGALTFGNTQVRQIRIAPIAGQMY